MSISQLLLGPVTSFGNVLDPSHPPSQHSCDYPGGSMIGKHFSIHITTPLASCNLHMDGITLYEPPGTAHSILTGHFQSLNPKLSYSLHSAITPTSCYIATLQCHLPPSQARTAHHYQMRSLVISLSPRQPEELLGCPSMVYRYRKHKNT